MSGTPSRTAVGSALLARVAPGTGRPLKKKADLSTVVLGHTDHYSPEMMDQVLREVSDLKASGGPLSKLTPAVQNYLADTTSFSAPADMTLTALRRAGIKARPYNILNSVFSPNAMMDEARRIAADPSVGSVIQIGALRPEHAKVLSDSGKYFTRLATDYGSGGFLQPRFHPWATPGLGEYNGMFIDPLTRYDAVYVPGGKLRNWAHIPLDRRVVSLDRLANLPTFSAASFKPEAGSPARAFFFSGGGSGAGLPFEYRPMGSTGQFTDRSLMHPAPNALSSLISALRKKHGAGNAVVDYVTGLKPEDNFALYEHLIRGSGKVHPAVDISARDDLRALRHALDPASPVYQRIARTAEGRALLGNIAERYRGLNIIGRVPNVDMAKYYGNADYVVGIPGSYVGEVAQMSGQKTPGFIHLIPQEHEFNPGHFRGNALATNALMQPGAQHNIVSVGSPTLVQDMERAVQEGGFRDWGRAKPMSSLEGMKPLVNDILRAHAKREFRNAGSQAVKSLWKIIRHIK